MSSSESSEYSDYGDLFDYNNKFKTFDDMVEYNIDWINNKIKNNVVSKTFGYANNGKYEMEPVIVNKDLMIKLNNLGFLTTGSQGGHMGTHENCEYKERAYVTGYIKTNIAKQLRKTMNYDNKYFQYIPITNITNCNINRDFEFLEYYLRVPVTVHKDVVTNEYLSETHIGMDYVLLILNSVESDLKSNLINNYSLCYSWDPLFGVPFDDKDNGLMTKLCDHIEKLSN